LYIKNFINYLGGVMVMEPILVHTKLNGIVGFAIQPFLKYIELIELIKFILINNIKKVALVDLGPSNEIVDFIKMLILFGIDVVYVDHHENQEKNLENYQIIYTLLGKNTHILPGKYAPSATSMVAIGEWLKENIELVFFHDDLDGYLAYAKGCYSKKLYDELDNDANKFEGQANGYNYSKLAQIYLRGIYLGPSYFINPPRRQENRQVLYDKLKLWIENEQNDSVIADYLNILEIEYIKNKELTISLFSKIEKFPGLIYIDIIREYKNEIKPNLGLLKAEMFKQGNNECVIAIRLVGKYGDQVSLFTPRNFKKHFKLYELLPYEEKNDWHRDSRLHIKYENFEFFKEKIKKFY